MSSYSPAEIEAAGKAAWKRTSVQAVRNAERPKYYVLENVPLFRRDDSHGGTAQLYAGRCHCAL